ncbi:hypothetical protein [Streptomyces huiliensis]|uniref:hypothetical protein n=1 Tax=Streptomyces huiliensis TaxID=2876027 RepID=UPI001CBCE3F0|nr:hypothetical protein [Streptomyces huiliensis]MBZ4321979.1 hypothetical protein [Streptomyces huiliensis]
MTSADAAQTPTTAAADSAAVTALKVMGTAALWLFAGLTFLILPFTVMASDGCNQGDTRAICTVAGQQAAAWIPWLTAPAAALLGTWGLMSRREGAPVAWGVALVMLMGAWVVVLGITGG